MSEALHPMEQEELLTSQALAIPKLLDAMTSTGRLNLGKAKKAQRPHSISTQIISLLLFSLSLLYLTLSSIRQLFWKVNVNLLCCQVDIWSEYVERRLGRKNIKNIV